MRFTLAQLRKLSLPYRYEEELDLWRNWPVLKIFFRRLYAM